MPAPSALMDNRRRTGLGTFLAAMVVVLSTSGAHCPGPPAARPVPAGKPFLVFLCKAVDDATEPNPPSFYEGLFSRSNKDLLFEYFNAASLGTFDVSNTDVFGWFTMISKTADLSPSVRNAGTTKTRTDTARECTNTALGTLAGRGIQVDPANYAGVMNVINVPVDSGAAGGRSMVVARPEGDIGFVVHELLHVVGLPHSRVTSADSSTDHAWNHGGDADYGDCWDMMSYRTCVYTFNTSMPFVSPTGPELQAAYREKLGWLPAARVSEVNTAVTAPKRVTLVPIGKPGSSGIMMARIALGSATYAVEYREKVGFDRGLPSAAVLIRELRGQHSYLVKRVGGGTAWTTGDRFSDTFNMLSITVDSMGSGSANITVDTYFSPTSLAPGDKCGDKFRGDVLPCPTGSTCGPRRSGQIQSIDYFCL